MGQVTANMKKVYGQIEVEVEVNCTVEQLNALTLKLIYILEELSKDAGNNINKKKE
jgi:hypothetical protein